MSDEPTDEVLEDLWKMREDDMAKAEYEEAPAELDEETRKEILEHTFSQRTRAPLAKCVGCGCYPCLGPKCHMACLERLKALAPSPEQGSRQYELSAEEDRAVGAALRASVEPGEFLAPEQGSTAAPEADDVQWVVNDNGELGVEVHGRVFFLYKGRSLVYEEAEHDDGEPMYYRPVYKREFGECCHPAEGFWVKGKGGRNEWPPAPWRGGWAEDWRPLPKLSATIEQGSAAGYERGAADAREAAATEAERLAGLAKTHAMQDGLSDHEEKLVRSTVEMTLREFASRLRAATPPGEPAEMGVTLGAEDAQALARWAKAATTGFGPAFNDAFAVAEHVERVLDARSSELVPEFSSSAPPGEQAPEGHEALGELRARFVGDPWALERINTVSSAYWRLRRLALGKSGAPVLPEGARAQLATTLLSAYRCGRDGDSQDWDLVAETLLVGWRARQGGGSDG